MTDPTSGYIPDVIFIGLWGFIAGLGLCLWLVQRAASNNDKETSPLEQRCYLMGESHLSGHRLVIGFKSMDDCHDAHDFLLRHYPQRKSPEAKP